MKQGQPVPVEEAYVIKGRGLVLCVPITANVRAGDALNLVVRAVERGTATEKMGLVVTLHHRGVAPSGTADLDGLAAAARKACAVYSEDSLCGAAQRAMFAYINAVRALVEGGAR